MKTNYELRLVTLANFGTPLEANLIKSVLEAAGIRSYVADEHVGGVLWTYTTAIGGIKLQVEANDLAAAEKILDDHTPADIEYAHDAELFDDGLGNPPAKDFESDKEQLVTVGDRLLDDIDSAATLSPLEEELGRASRAAVLGLLFFPLQFYASWLLLDILCSSERLPQRAMFKLYCSLALNVSVMLVYLVVVKVFIEG